MYAIYPKQTTSLSFKNNTDNYDRLLYRCLLYYIFLNLRKNVSQNLLY